MKARKFVGGMFALVGLVAAVSVCDGSAHELLIRGIGLAMFVIGAYTARLFDFKSTKP